MLGAWVRQPLMYGKPEQAKVAKVGKTYRFEYVETHYKDTRKYIMLGDL